MMGAPTPARAAACAVVLLLAACGGGGAGALPGSSSVTAPATQPASGATAQTTFRIDAPSIATTSSAARSPKYVSANTASVSIALAGQAPLAVVNLAPSSAGCSTTTAGTTCTVTVNAPIGADTFIVTAYSGANGTGSVLSTAIAIATVALNASNVVPLVLNGVVATATVILSSTSVVVGAPATIAVTVVAYDATDEIIIGPGNYSSPVALTDTDASGMTSLSATQVLAPGTNTTLTYRGGSMVSATITPSVGGTTGTAAVFAPTGYAIADYPVPGPFGDVFAMDAGPDGNVWFSSYNNGMVANITPAGAITTYSAGLLPNEVSALAPGSNGAEWFGDTSGDVGYVTPAGAVTYAGSYNTPCESETTTCGPFNWLVLGPDNDLWFSDDAGYIGTATNAGAVQEWDITALPGWPGGTAEPIQIAFGPDGNIYAADDTEGEIYRITLAGDQPSSVTAVPTDCGPYGTFALAVGTDGNVWFADGGEGCSDIGAVPLANFTPAALQEWSMEGVTGGSTLFPLVSSPGGLWTADGSNAVYRIVNTGGTAAPVPEIIAVKPFANPQALGLGPDGNVWTASAGGCDAPSAIAKIVYGAPGTGTQSITRKLPAVTHRAAAGQRVRWAAKRRRLTGEC